VVDPTDALVPEALVILTDVDTGVSRDMRTDSTGSFRFDRVQPGTYAVRIEKQGFRSQQITGLIVTVGKDTSAGRIALKVGAPAETIGQQ
jgi:protocatechuate 3,4-dioxygenase beta subunit